ncbi:MAG TPA: tRNA adenosine deaminase-associated protein [Actinomycetales bacterium]|nr:tRNA adenosine deaminase-associated protein [Actinomycetales bacterium]
MPGTSTSEVEDVDFAVVAYAEEGVWHLQDLPESALETVEDIGRQLRRYPGDDGAVALVSVDEDFIVIVRARGPELSLLLSDATAATDWLLAKSVVDLLGLPVEDDDEQAPAGDLAILADLGMPAIDMGVLLDDYDLYPDEVLSAVARRIGFGKLFDDHLGLVEE